MKVATKTRACARLLGVDDGGPERLGWSKDVGELSEDGEGCGEDAGGAEEEAGVDADGKRGELETARVHTADRNPIEDHECDRP